MQLAKFQCQQATYNQHFYVHDCVDKPDGRTFLFEILLIMVEEQQGSMRLLADGI